MLSNEHAFRAQIYEELHSRPPPEIDTPCVVSHIAVQVEESDRGAELTSLAALCIEHGVKPPASGSAHFYATLGPFELRWERHTEFSSFTFIRKCDESALWEQHALSTVPPGWLEGLPGRLVVAIHLAFSAADASPTTEMLTHFFDGYTVFGGAVRRATASLFGSFRRHDDGFGRVLLHGRELLPLQAGRLLQRVLEIETYRLVALLALPIARTITPDLHEMEQSLALLSHRLTEAGDGPTRERLLNELSDLAARVERERSNTTYRFAATNAYYGLVQERLKELDESKLPGLQPINVFIQRRLAPGIRTCNAVRDRLEDLSRRINRASDLLRTAVELSIQDQNRELLTAMNRRGEIQLRLQQAVEGLSVVAVTYYAIGLLGYALEALPLEDLGIDKKSALAIAIPAVLVLAWILLHGVSRRIRAG